MQTAALRQAAAEDSARTAEEGGCIFTTACCSYLGLPDDCDELMAMRGFRDNYLRFLPDGEDMIAEYYRIAQPIVDVINSKSDKDSIYKAIYERLKNACRL